MSSPRMERPTICRVTALILALLIASAVAGQSPVGKDLLRSRGRQVRLLSE